MQIGFSTGCLFKSGLSGRAKLEVLKQSSSPIIELGFLSPDDLGTGFIETITRSDLEGFEYVSLHAPKLMYGENEETKEVFEKIASLHERRTLDAVVVHPDTVEDFAVFEKAAFPVAFENMDRNKESYTTPDEMVDLFEKIGSKYKFVFDMNHVYTHDPSMALAREFYEKLGDRIDEIHLSGYEKLHEALVDTKQTQIMDAIEDRSVPIILEGQIEAERLEEERAFVSDYLSKR